ncbi:ABC transporter substrate-binding protein [Micromonospora sp. NBC_01796]|uniref:ABC transporter substrate-binding protein n=1 Tax=Micromonospora sp. NBC_01796 TaxID=2975987 RepID=UPI002DD9043B|nr:ABC transporter substrate-binding protein [Micromonospora sp. NBC_01796]WSA89340.1 ABC transporter substrate-binding protein [Micromonospora sp. NBC_01796]
MRTGRAVAVTGVALLLASALAACSENTGDTDAGPDDGNIQQQTSAIATDPKESQGPAPEIAGAKRGGTIRTIVQQDFEHLDPQRTYLVGAMAAEHLLVRTLTQFREDGKGKLTLVGDLGETPGKDVNGDCKVWEYKIKQGVKYEDGTDVKAADVAYGIARSFEESIDGGPTYIQEWLADNQAYNANYKGPYTSGSTTVPGLTTPDDRTLVFTFAKPHCDLPFAASLPTTAPVPQAKDTKTEYDRRIFSSGPYKIKEYLKDTRLVLERNPHWKAETDPLRHDYPDSFVWELGPDDTAQTERIIADAGDDAYAISTDGAPQALVNQVLNNPSLKERTISAPQPFVHYLSINNERIKDINVRKAIAYAIDKQGIVLTQGGDAGGKVTNTLLADSTIGWKNYPNPWDGGPNGNPEKARELLGGQKIKLVFMARSNAFGQVTAPVVKESLEKAGFEVVVKTVETPQHNPTARTRGNEYDIYISNWAADWPSAASTIPVLWDGRSLGPKGNSNVSYFNSDEVNQKIDEVSALPAGEAGPKWAEIDQLINEKYVPVVPLFQAYFTGVVGSKVGGVFFSDVIGTHVLYNAYAK